MRRMQHPQGFRTCALLALALASGIVLAPARVGAQPASPRPDGLDVSKVEVVGLPAELAEFPREGLALMPRTRVLSVRRTPLTQRKLEADRERIRFYLVRRGYPDAVVIATATADRKDRRATVRFTVEPGARVRYGTVTVTGLPPALEDKARRRLAEAAPAGGPFDQDTVEALRAELLEKVLGAGHARPDVKVQVRRDAGTAAVSFVVAPGPSYVFGGVAVLGVAPDLTSLAARVIGLAPGEPATASRLRDVSRDLRKLSLFRQIDVATAPAGPDTLDLTAKLTLQAMTTWELSLGTFTDQGLRGSAAWTNRNLLKRGRSLRLSAAASQHEIETLARTSWPALVLRRSRTDLSLSFDATNEDNYVQRTAEAEIAFAFDPWDKTTARLGFALSLDEVSSDSSSSSIFSDNAGWTPLLRARITRDAVDQFIEPGDGYRATLAAEWSPPVGFSQNPYFWLHGYGSLYRSIGKGTVVATRLDLGFAGTLGNATDLLPDNRFFAGGSTSMRGYERRRLGQVDGANEPLGGEVVALAGSELRQHVATLIGVQVGCTFFVDSGQVWLQRQDARVDDLRAAWGFGLLIGTPVGPLRFERAENIGSPMHGDPDVVYHFALGHPY